MEESDVQLQLKKRARRRLVGAVAFVSFVALVLPMVMDQEPRPPVQDVEIRIPGQDEKPFAPKFAGNAADRNESAVKPADTKRDVPAPEAPREAAVAVPQAAEPEKPKVQEKPTAQVLERVEKQLAEKPAEKAAEKTAEKVADKALEKAAAKPAEKAADKATDKPAEKTADKKPAGKDSADAKRAAALLSGGHADAAPAAAPVKSGEYLVLIGAFANEANVKNLKAKLGEQGIKTFTEPLDTPQGRKTRLRAGPFANREAADKALEKMQRIGVSGVVSGK